MLLFDSGEIGKKNKKPFENIQFVYSYAHFLHIKKMMELKHSY